jgi:hypothetical protein
MASRRERGVDGLAEGEEILLKARVLLELTLIIHLFSRVLIHWWHCSKSVLDAHSDEA